MRKNRVSDGVRTRDNRNHNPRGKEEDQRLSAVPWATAGTEALGNSGAGVPGPGFRFGERVVIVNGLSKGLEGVVDQRSTLMFGPIPTYMVKFPKPEGLRVIRADYLQRVGG